MIAVKVLQRGQKKALAKLVKMSGNVKRPRALYARWAIQALRWIDQNFKTEGANLKEGTWKELKTSTLRSRRKGRVAKKRAPKILQDTGRLKSSFTYRILSNNTGVAIGTSVHYSKYHEHGTKRGLPQRRMLPTEKDETWTKQMDRTTKNWLKEISK